MSDSSKAEKSGDSSEAVVLEGRLEERKQVL
jgi:hypothetical protein